MQIPGLGEVTEDESTEWLCSEPLQLKMFGGETCQVVLEGYEDDPNQQDFHAAIEAFLTSGPDVLTLAEPHIFKYYRDMNRHWNPSDEEFVAIESPGQIWRHIQLGAEAMVCRREHGDLGVYISLGCNCDWEPEHGLQIVFKNGNSVCKIGPYNGHLSNADAYADDSLEHVIYRGIA